jgi:hypothetical protein
MAKTASKARSLFDEDVLEVSRAGLPDTGRRAPVRTVLYKSYVWVAVILFVPALLAIVVTAGSSAGGTATGSSASTATSSPGRTAATLTLQAWLAEIPAPLPGGHMLSWDKAVTQPAPSQPPKAQGGGGTVTYKTEVDSFTVLDSASRLYTASVQVAIDPRGGGAQSLGGPSLTPVIPAASDGWAQGGPWPGLSSSATVSTSVQAAITGWATAYTSGSADSLRLAVGDTNATDTYFPLTGVSSVTATPLAAATYGSPDTMIVQVSLDIVWAGQKSDAAGTTGAPQTTMDLLVRRAGTAAPVVTAWGAPGTGPTLADRANAVTAPGVVAPSSVPTGN